MKLSKVCILILTIFSTGTLFMSGCYYDNLQELRPASTTDSAANKCDTAKVMSFATDIQPVLSGNCGTGTPCHSSSTAQSGVDLSTYEGVKAVADDGKLISSIKWDDVATFSHMPKNSPVKISDCAMAKISKWVGAGAPNN